MADLSPEQETVFERLRAWRGATAKEQGVPAYVVFHDATLRAIAVTAPSTLSALAGVNGVGESKLTKYGESILDLLASYGRRLSGRPAGRRSATSGRLLCLGLLGSAGPAAARDLGGQRVERLGERGERVGEPLEPRPRGVEPFGVQGVEPAGARGAHAHQAGVEQHLEMLRHRGLRDRRQ